MHSVKEVLRVIPGGVLISFPNETSSNLVREYEDGQLTRALLSFLLQFVEDRLRKGAPDCRLRFARSLQ